MKATEIKKKQRRRRRKTPLINMTMHIFINEQITKTKQNKRKKEKN